ncbi:hypothetical protein SAMN06269185_2677 [Natronoarchaeum philippinense]|uniref:Uncharacterized protein n=1 Tax=Natronoarchaeum philippinense TaxID=558529 RepID=A0A285P7B5_NATPI|nr:hypothetical protein SAMN06269185_2677 [Natronoarchaeum philippinense]
MEGHRPLTASCEGRNNDSCPRIKRATVDSNGDFSYLPAGTASDQVR